MKDILPSEQVKWNFVRDVLKNVSETRGYERIDTPLIEQSNLFKEVFDDDERLCNFTPNTSKTEITLRPEATASICRAFIEGALNQEPKPILLYYEGPMFFKDNGNLEQFHVFGAEAFGKSSDHVSDCSSISFAWHFLKALGFEDLIVKINYLGDREQFEKLDKFMKDWGYLIDGFRHEVDENLVPRYAYYDGPFFEIVYKSSDTHHVTIAGGGRYDHLVKHLGGPDISLVGFSVVLDLVVELLPEDIVEEIRVGEKEFHELAIKKWNKYMDKINKEIDENGQN